MSIKLEVIGIDASRIRSGGAIIHALKIIENIYMNKDIKIHVWLPKVISKKVKARNNLFLHTPKLNEKNILFQLCWQTFLLKKKLRSLNVNILFTLDAATLNTFQPQIILSQDLLAYEKDLVSRYKYSWAWLRLKIIKLIQNSALKNASGVIFLSEFALKVISREISLPKKIKIIPHGVTKNFANNSKIRRLKNKKIKAVYVSPIAEYKNQAVVAEAAILLKEVGHDFEIDFIGGTEIASNNYLSELETVMLKANSLGCKTQLLGSIPNNKLHLNLGNYDLFIFASSIENLPITILEAMSMGLPIASSSCGPMPEILLDSATYFQPNNPISIKEAVERYFKEPYLLEYNSSKALKASKKYTWENCIVETELFIDDVWDNL